MPIRLEDSREYIEDVGEEVGRKAKRLWHGFSSFALQDNVLEVAVGLIIASAFTSLVTSFVSEILLPPLSLLPFINRNMEEKFAILRIGQGYHHNGTHGYNTLEQALADGAVVLAYGYVHFSTLLSSNPLTMVIDTGEYVYKRNTDARRTFLNKVFNFMGVGMALYTVASVYEWCSNDSIIKCTVKCKYCKKRISEKALRCVNCTSWMDGREDR